jgi:ribosome biogenesis GTPase
VTPVPRSLRALGWTRQRDDQFAPLAAAGLHPGRVTAAGGLTIAQTAAGPVEVTLQRRFRRSVASAADLPVVGDWLALEPDAAGARAALRLVLPRDGRVARADVSASRPDAHVDAQVLAANVDIALLVSAVGRDLNPRRIERYLVTAWAGGLQPVIVLNKVDVAEDLVADLVTIARVAGDVPVHAVSARTGEGLAGVRARLGEGVTGCLLGSSGVGKSTIVNAFLGEARQDIHDVRRGDERGRHTTTRRELLGLPGGGLIIDTPGLRAMGAWDDGSGLARAFVDVQALAGDCRFRDCRHEHEPGCAVRAAVERGDLDARRLDDLRKLDREARALELRSDIRAARAESRRLGRCYRDITLATERKRWRLG